MYHSTETTPFGTVTYWWNKGKTYLRINVSGITFGMYRYQVQSLIDGLTWESYKDGYKEPQPDADDRKKINLPVVSWGSNSSNYAPIFFNGFDFEISPQDVEILVRLLQARLAEPADPQLARQELIEEREFLNELRQMERKGA